MITYETRLVAALRSFGADDQLVDEALATLQDFPADEEELTREFGEPEDYARALAPEGQEKKSAPFTLSGMILAVVAFIALRLADDADWEPLDGWELLQYPVPFVLMGGGILVDFWRYIRQGKR